MSKMYNWKLALAIMTFIFSVVSFWAEMNGKETLDIIVTAGYSIVLAMLIIIDIIQMVRVFKRNSDCEEMESYEDVVKYNNSKLKRKLSKGLSVLLLTCALVGILIYRDDTNIIAKNIFSLLFTLALILEAVIDLSESKSFNV